MTLRQYLKKRVGDNVAQLRKAVLESEIAFSKLQDIRLDRSDYIVKLYSLWADHGEKSVSVEHRGKLEDAIKKAEDDFKRTNKRPDVQARYYIEIKLGEKTYDIPEEYFKEFQEKRIKQKLANTIFS